MNRLGRKGVAVVLFAKVVVSINHRAARGGESIRKRKVIEPSQCAAGGINRSSSGNHGHLRRHLRNPGMRISSHIAILEHILPDRIGIVVTEPVTKVVSFTPKLSLPGDGVQLVRIRVNAKITTTQRNRLPICPFSLEIGGEGGRRPDEGA